jgi:hypothetical protein
MMARKIKAGTICINCHNYGDPAWPFGGYKQSGWGREMGKEAIVIRVAVDELVIGIDARPRGHGWSTIISKVWVGCVSHSFLR